MLDLSKIPLNEYGHVQTRDGRPVRLLCRDFKSALPGRALCGVILHEGDIEGIYTWFPDGSNSSDGRNIHDSSDLVPVPKKVKVDFWMNIYNGDVWSVVHGTRFKSRELADEAARNVADRRRRIACLHIEREVTAGEGL